MTWRLWAVAVDAPQAAYGVTAVYDAAQPLPPPRLAESLAGAEERDIRRAALVLADVLNGVATRLRELGTDLGLTASPSPSGSGSSPCRSDSRHL
jgi:hypothetical protein